MAEEKKIKIVRVICGDALQLDLTKDNETTAFYRIFKEVEEIYNRNGLLEKQIFKISEVKIMDIFESEFNSTKSANVDDDE